MTTTYKGFECTVQMCETLLEFPARKAFVLVVLHHTNHGPGVPWLTQSEYVEPREHGPPWGRGDWRLVGEALESCFVRIMALVGNSPVVPPVDPP